MIKHSVNYSYFKNVSKAVQAGDKQTVEIIIFEMYKLKSYDAFISTKSMLHVLHGIP